MLLEHAFVTTLDEQAALDLAETLMRDMRFDRRPDPAPRARRFDNGRTNPNRARKATELPMSVWLEFDRGRVSLAVSIEESPRFKRQRPLLSELLLSMSHAVEQTLAAGPSADPARERWNRVVAAIDERDRRRRRRNRIILALFFAAVLGTIGVLAWISHR